MRLLGRNNNGKNTPASITSSEWKSLFRAGGFAALIIAAFIPVQVGIFIFYPPPTSVEGFFRLFGANNLLGLLEYDLLIIIDMTLLILIYLALYKTLQKFNQVLTLIAVTFGMIGITIYFASNTSLEMLSLSKQFALAKTNDEKNLLLASGQAIFEIYNGTAFTIYYELSAIAILLFSLVMPKSPVFKMVNAYLGLLAGILMLVPPIPSLGNIGIFFSFFSLIPLIVWLILFARNMFNIGKYKTRISSFS